MNDVLYQKQELFDEQAEEILALNEMIENQKDEILTLQGIIDEQTAIILDLQKTIDDQTANIESQLHNKKFKYKIWKQQSLQIIWKLIDFKDFLTIVKLTLTPKHLFMRLGSKQEKMAARYVILLYILLVQG